MIKRTEKLALRLEQGARALAEFAANLTDDEWKYRVPGDGRKFGVLVHHVASMYPLEINLAQKLAAGNAIEGVMWNDVHTINAAHARDNDGVSKGEAIRLLQVNSALAAAAIRVLDDMQLDLAAPISLNADAPL